MPRKRTSKQDRTGLIISLVVHALVVGGVLYWAAHTETGQELLKRYLEFVRSEKKRRVEEATTTKPDRPPPPPPPPSADLPKGLTPPASSGIRRAVASDAPAAAGDTFFVDTRTQGKGSAKGDGGGGQEQKRSDAIRPERRPLTAPPPKLSIFKAPPSTIKALYQERSKAAAAVEEVSAEQISKSGVSDAADIVSKVSGATVSGEGYAVIRGLTDRYSAATLNGAELPSSDPYRRSASLDMFPAKIIDRVSVTKTFTPDQPGSFTGGNINIVTKSFPERPFFTFELGGTYNTQASLNDNFLSYPGGDRDWLGMDDGTRALPSELETIERDDFPRARDRVRVTTSLPAQGEQLLQDVFQLDDLTRNMGSTAFGPATESSPLNHGFSLAGGSTALLFTRPVGVFFSLPYSHSYSFYDNGEVGRFQYDPTLPVGELEQRKGFSETKAAETVNWSGTLNLAYQLSEDHEVGFNFLYNQFAEDSARVRVGWDANAGDVKGSAAQEQNRLQWIERNLTMYQMKGGHLFPSLGDTKFDWLATLTDTTQDEPDVRFYSSRDGNFGDANLDPQYPRRFFRHLEENNLNLKFDFAVPFNPLSWNPGEIKFGYFDSSSTRSFKERFFDYNSSASAHDPNAFLTPDTLGLESATTNVSSRFTTVDFRWHSYLQPPFDNKYSGDRSIWAGYLMTDFPIGRKLRLVGGARYETTDIEVISESNLGGTSGTGGAEVTSALQENHVLPALGLVYALRPDMNLRLNYGATIARPSFRELAPILSYDPVLDVFLTGNHDLDITEIQNYDFRWEWFPNPGEILSVGFFYKDLKNIIEKRDKDGVGDFVTYVNRDAAKVYGVEFEARKTLGFILPEFRNFSVGGNLTLIESEVPIPEDEQNRLRNFRIFETKRPLADQSPYILNLDVSYDNPRSGTSASLQFNMFGPRLVITTQNSADLYEQPAPGLDFILSQQLGRKMKVKFSAKNLLDPTFKLTYGKSGKDVYSSHTKGMSFGLSLAYEF